MLIILKVQGCVFNVEELVEVPCVGEVVNVNDRNFVVAGLRLAESPLNSTGYPILNLQPIVQA